WLALGTNLVGMKIGKWTENVGGASVWLLGAVLGVVAIIAWKHRGPATPLDIRPAWNWGTVSLWSSIAYAMSGLELVAMIGSEIRDPERTLPRAGWMATGFVTLFYIATTVAMLVLLRPGEI